MPPSRVRMRAIRSDNGLPSSPLSWSRKRRSDVFGAFCSKKPDTDNVAKAILDAMNGIVYEDDAQVAGLIVQKFYAEKDEINIKVFTV